MFSIVPYSLAAISRSQAARECQQHLDPQSLCAQELFITMLIDYGRNRARLWQGKSDSGQQCPCRPRPSALPQAMPAENQSTSGMDGD